jgi:rod shape-determining protein MreC
MYQNQKKKHGNLVFVVLLLIGFSFIIFRLSMSINLVKFFIYYIAYPNIGVANYIFRSAGSFQNNIKAMVYLRQENIAYKQKNHELIDKLRNYCLISQEYENLSKLLKFQRIQDTKSVFAKISVRNPSEWYQWIIIDKGYEDGLYNELPVVVLNLDINMLCAMGRIVETYKNSSKVALITNSVSALPVEIKGKAVNCLAEGFNSGLLKVTYIVRGADVKVGDEIVASELTSIFPKGIPVGVIRSITEEPLLDFKTAKADIFFEGNVLYDAVILVPQI